MTTVWMDPEQLKATAATIGELAMQIQETMTGTRSVCVCEVPRSLIGWLDEELQAITVGALQAALGYLEQAVEVKTRADLLQADQSLVAAVASPGAVTAAVGGATTQMGPWHETADGRPYVPSSPVWDPTYGWVSTAPLPKLTDEGWRELMRNGKADVGPGPGGGDPNILAEISGQQSANANRDASWGTTRYPTFNENTMQQGLQYGGNEEPRPGPEPVPPPKPPPPSGP